MSKEGLGEENEQRIQKNYELLISDIDIPEIIDKFIEDGYFKMGIEEDIKAEASPPTPKNKNKIFIQKLLKCSPSAYTLLSDQLAEKGFHHIVDALKATQITLQSKPKAKNRFEELDPKLRDLRLGDKETLKFNMVIGKDVELLAKAMELSQAEIDQIRMEAQFSAATQIHKIFTKWRYRYGNKATLGLLTRTLEEAQMYGAAVDWEKYDYAVGILSQAVAQNPNYVKQMST